MSMLLNFKKNTTSTLMIFHYPNRNGPNPGWMQYDDSTDVDDEGNIVSIGGFPLNEDMIYRVGSFQGTYVIRNQNQKCLLGVYI